MMSLPEKGPLSLLQQATVRHAEDLCLPQIHLLYMYKMPSITIRNDFFLNKKITWSMDHPCCFY